MEGLDVHDVYQHYRLDPTEVEAVTYYLPRLIAGETLHGAEKLIYRVDIYGCEPKDLAAQFAPVPQAASSGDRFFFTTCKRKNGSKTQSVRSAGGGTWTIQKTTEISHAGGKVGEVKNLSFKKKGKSTGWVMEEYRCLLPEATVTDGVKVFCKIHLAQHPPDAARQESAAYKRQEPQREPVTASTHAHKRPAPQPEHVQKRPALPAAAADPHPPRPNKRMRVAVPVPAPAIPSFTAAAPASLPAASIPEADDDIGRFCCSIDELLGVQVPVGADNNIELELSSYFEPDELQKLLADVAEEIMWPYLNPTEPEPRPSFADPFEAVVEQQQPQAVSTSDKSSMVQDVGTYKPPLSFFDPFEAAWRAEEALENEKRYNAAADLQAPSLQGQDHLFKSRPNFVDPFEAAWKAEEALESGKRYNDPANLHAGPLGGHNNFFSSASVH